MTISATPRIDVRDQQAIVQELRAKLTAFVPNWLPASGGPGAALLQIFGRYTQVLTERLNQAPDRNKLAFLDMLGANLLPAQAARAPVVFTAVPHTGDGRVPAHTRLGAKISGRSEPLIFETESDIALAGARLAEVVALWPGRDSYADHSTAVIGGQPFTLFTSLQPIPHELYLAHETLFALSGFATLEIQFALSSTASQPLAIVWEYWQGKTWRAFKPFKPVNDAGVGDSFDGTQGFTRSGIVRLVADCAAAKKNKVNGLESFWIKVRPEKTIPDQPGQVWPRIDRISARSVIANPLRRFVIQSQEQAAGSPGKVSVLGPAFRTMRGKAELRGPNFYDIRATERSEQAAEWQGLTPGQYHLQLTQPGFAPFDFSFTLSAGSGIRLFVRASIEKGGIEAEAAYSEGQKVDLTKAFYPFTQQSQTGHCFFIKSTEVFGKPGASVVMAAQGVITPQVDLALPPTLTLVVEAWDGQHWQNVNAPANDLATMFTFTGLNTVQFDLPLQLATTTVNGEEGGWLRIRIASGGFARSRQINIEKSDPITILEYLTRPIEQLRIGYEYHSAWESLQACLTHNDFQWRDCSDDARRQGTPFEPFTPVADRTPALYLGFDSSLPADIVSLYMDIQEVPGQTDGSPLTWEYWDSTTWLPLSIQDESHNLALPGMVSILWPGEPGLSPATVLEAKGTKIKLAEPRDVPRFFIGDQLFIEQKGEGELLTVAGTGYGVITAKTVLSKDYSNAQVSRAKLPRFGRPRTWVRARLQVDADPPAVRFNGIYLNAAWAAQLQTFENEVLGSSNGQLNQVQFLRNTPVLPGQAIEVRELDGPRARVELPILIQDLEVHGMSESDIRTVSDRRTGEISQVWVRWQERPNLFFSAPDDRHYLIERSRGRIVFGDNRHGRIPPVGPDCIMARYYRAGGGVISNVSAGAINQILAGVLAKSVTNPRAAEGGADTEQPTEILERGPLLVRNRRQALSTDDYEAMAREASPAVAVARALPTTHPSGRFAPGWVKLVIMPHSQDAKPQPSFELRRLVHDFLTLRMPASTAGQIYVTGPDYLEVGVVAVVAVTNRERAGPVLQDVTRRLQTFLNPLNGGPEGNGWPFGRDVYLSDVAAAVEAITGVDYLKTLELTIAGTPYGEVIEVPENRIVVAGPLRVTLGEGD